MRSVKSGAVLRTTLLAAFAAGCLATTTLIPPARADATGDAVEIIKKMSDEQIRAELQKRLEARRDVQKSPSLAGAPPAPASEPAPSAPTAGDAPAPAASGSGTSPKPEEPLGAQRRTMRAVGMPIETVDDATLTTALRATSRAIYGVDDRREWHQLKDEKIRGLARSAVAMFRTSDTQMSPTNIRLKTRTLGEDQALCRGELFADQTTGAFCSGTLVRDDVVLTAGHCVQEISKDPEIPTVDQLVFAFGYRVERPGGNGTTDLPADQIYKGKAVLKGEFSGDRDWAMVQLDRPVAKTVAEPVTAWRKTSVTKGQKVFVIGYPNGLPVKYAPNAEIRDTSNPAFFVANLDTFGGNSGSGVYDATTNELIGVLVRGEVDYVKDEKNGCMRVFTCPKTSCRGEDIIRIGLIPAP